MSAWGPMLEYSRLEGDHIQEDDKTVSKVKGAQGAEFNSMTDESHLPFDLLELIMSQGKELTAIAPSESKAANKVSDAKSVYKNQNYRNLKETALPEPKQPAFFTEVSCPELETPPLALLISASVTALPEPNLQTL
ncbi:hypothetical protein Tco_0265718 [Tanacetum coccineum]